MSQEEFDFNHIVDRTGTRSVKLDFSPFVFGVPIAFPMWVADADYAAPEFVMDAIRKRLEHPILGYSLHTASYQLAVRNWLESRFQFPSVSDASIVTAVGVVPALAICVRAFTKPGDLVLTMPLVYYPFGSVVENNDRKLCSVPLRRVERDDSDPWHCEIDIDALRAAIVNEKPRALLFCSPHNPIGRLWTDAELTAVGDLCLEHGVTIVSDEIWAPMTLPAVADDFSAVSDAPKRRFVPFAAAANGKYREILVTCTSASKSFNLAAIQDSAIVIENQNLRARYLAQVDAQGMFAGNFAAPIATEACYSPQGHRWLDACVLHVAANVQFLRRALAFGVDRVDSCTVNDTPTYPLGIRANRPEATYLVWLDCRELCKRLDRAGYKGLPPAASAGGVNVPQAHEPSDPRIESFNKSLVEHLPLVQRPPAHMHRSSLLEFFAEKCGVGLDDGAWFGDDGKHCVRINVATPRATLLGALQRIAQGIASLE